MKHYKGKNVSKAVFLIYLSWLVYAISYLGKVNYSANITQIIDFYGVTKTQAGIVQTFFFFSYGVGQVVNGVLCKKYNIKWMIFISLSVSAVINLIIAVSREFSIIKWLWLINGFALSVLWPTIIRQLSEALPKQVLGVSSVVMGTTVAIGTLIIYGLSSIYAVFDKFIFSFYTAGIAVIIVAVIWLILYDKAVALAKNEKDQEEHIDIIFPIPRRDADEVEQRVHDVQEFGLYDVSRHPFIILCRIFDQQSHTVFFGAFLQFFRFRNRNVTKDIGNLSGIFHAVADAGKFQFFCHGLCVCFHLIGGSLQGEDRCAGFSDQLPDLNDLRFNGGEGAGGQGNGILRSEVFRSDRQEKHIRFVPADLDRKSVV